jgi:hypothetical protein
MIFYQQVVWGIVWVEAGAVKQLEWYFDALGHLSRQVRRNQHIAIAAVNKQ